MRAVLLFASILSFAVTFAAGDPIPFGLGSGPPQGGTAGRDVLWSQPVDENGDYVGSEIISRFGLEDEVADDFVLPVDGLVTLTHVTWWGGEYQYVPGDSQMTAFNLLFYEEDPDPSLCRPVEQPFLTILGTQPVRETVFDEFGLALRKYDLDLAVDVPGQTRIWLVVQASDHDYPPQWARFESLASMECEAMFRSVYFGYPNWVSVTELIGTEFRGAAFELAGTSEPTVVQSTTWGRIRGLYR